MKKIFTCAFLIANLSAFLTPAHACGMPAAPDEHSILSLDNPAGLLAIVFLSAAIVAAVGPSIRKKLSKLGR